MKFLVVGCGSIGERHIRNLMALDQQVEAYDVAENRLLEMQKKYEIKTYPSIEDALKDEKDAALICTPTSLHIQPALAAIRTGYHVFIEKPLSHTLDGVDELLKAAHQRNLVILVGCNMRFHSALIWIRKLLEEGSIGNVVAARVEFGQYLPDWHLWEDYRKGYSANRSLGGGIILDAIHELDYIHWFLGEVKEVFCFSGKLSHLEITTEDIAEILLKFESGAIAGVHLDYIQRSYQRSCELIGEEGTIIWNYNEGLVKHFSAAKKDWESFDVNRNEGINQMYLREMQHFIKCVNGEETPMLDGEEGKRILQIALAAKKSSELGRSVIL